ncbi:MAG: 1-acyl-sn-glycerol-3-phosphate acyltransferase [Candidatus Buchananbacteria bacterium]|nr:1-acyl-sn-glycerol-3-phosphate acyltransferase [Candidatus Buchananbacteria bacterium]
MKFIQIVISGFLWLTGLSSIVVLVPTYLLIVIVFGGRQVRGLERLLARAILFAFGQRLEVWNAPIASEHARRVYLFNHASYLDAFVLAAAILDYIRAVGAAYHFKWPVWGSLLRQRGIIPVHREKHVAAVEAMIQAENEVLGKGDSLIVSPEGTRSDDGQLLPFKKGAFHAIKKTNANVVLMVIKGAHQALPKHSWLLRPGTIQVHFEEWPAEKTKHLEAHQLLLATRERFLELMA